MSFVFRFLTLEILNGLPPENVVGVPDMSQSSMLYASKAYANVAKEAAAPRELELRLLLQAAAKLQAVHDAWCDKPPGLSDAVLYNRRLWIVFIDAVMRDDNQLPIAIRQNILNLGIFVMGETFSFDDAAETGSFAKHHQDQSCPRGRPEGPDT